MFKSKHSFCFLHGCRKWVENCAINRQQLIPDRYEFYKDDSFSVFGPPVHCILCLNLHNLLSYLICLTLFHQSDTCSIIFFCVLFSFSLFLYVRGPYHEMGISTVILWQPLEGLTWSCIKGKLASSLFNKDDF